MNTTEILNNFRSDMEMTDIEYKNFCNRYATRNHSTVIWYLAQLYGKLPKGIGKALRIEMQRSVT